MIVKLTSKTWGEFVKFLKDKKSQCLLSDIYYYDYDYFGEITILAECIVYCKDDVYDVKFITRKFIPSPDEAEDYRKKWFDRIDSLAELLGVNTYYGIVVAEVKE